MFYVYIYKLSKKYINKKNNIYIVAKSMVLFFLRLHCVVIKTYKRLLDIIVTK